MFQPLRKCDFVICMPHPCAYMPKTKLKGFGRSLSSLSVLLIRLKINMLNLKGTWKAMPGLRRIVHSIVYAPAHPSDDPGSIGVGLSAKAAHHSSVSVTGIDFEAFSSACNLGHRLLDQCIHTDWVFLIEDNKLVCSRPGGGGGGGFTSLSCCLLRWDMHMTRGHSVLLFMSYHFRSAHGAMYLLPEDTGSTHNAKGEF